MSSVHRRLGLSEKDPCVQPTDSWPDRQCPSIGTRNQEDEPSDKKSDCSSSSGITECVWMGQLRATRALTSIPIAAPGVPRARC